jgi:hypothetical protein
MQSNVWFSSDAKKNHLHLELDAIIHYKNNHGTRGKTARMYQAKENPVQLRWRHISVPSSSDQGDTKENTAPIT